MYLDKEEKEKGMGVGVKRVVLLSLWVAMVGVMMGVEVFACPSIEQVQEGIKKVFDKNFEVKNVQPSKELPGICEAHVIVQERYNIL